MMAQGFDSFVVFPQKENNENRLFPDGDIHDRRPPPMVNGNGEKRVKFVCAYRACKQIKNE
ncbi:MAG: hypothetical protein RR459_02710 [Christensenellaceae bacterium]